jgi:uncharacterized protein YcfL
MKSEVLYGALTLCLLAAGCQTAVVSPIPTSGVQMDEASASHFKCLSYETRTLENRLLQAQAQIQNLGAYPRSMRYHAEWYSEEGNRLGESHWELRIAQPNETFFITVVAHDATAARIRLYLK